VAPSSSTLTQYHQAHFRSRLEAQLTYLGILILGLDHHPSAGGQIAWRVRVRVGVGTHLVTTTVPVGEDLPSDAVLADLAQQIMAWWRGRTDN
jgi:hypothetical protein